MIHDNAAHATGNHIHGEHGATTLARFNRGKKKAARDFRRTDPQAAQYLRVLAFGGISTPTQLMTDTPPQLVSATVLDHVDTALTLSPPTEVLPQAQTDQDNEADLARRAHDFLHFLVVQMGCCGLDDPRVPDHQLRLQNDKLFLMQFRLIWRRRELRQAYQNANIGSCPGTLPSYCRLALLYTQARVDAQLATTSEEKNFTW